MAKRGRGIIAFLLCFCLMSCAALAVSALDVKELISTDKACSLTIGYGYDGMVFPDQTVALYKVAEVSADCQYALTSSFAASGLILNGVQTNGEWDVIRSTLEVQILTNNIEPIETMKTDESGQVRFLQLTPGLYLASAVDAVQGDFVCCFDSALIALPGLGTDGLWQYSVAVTAKPKVLPPIQPEEEIQWKVLKLWKGDEGRTDRPQSIEVEIFRDGISYETVTLSAENNWSYQWLAKNDGASWKVAERNVPAGYTMTVAEREASFVLTNVWTSDTPEKPPQTGDTANILLYIILMILSGSMLVVLGITGKRKSV